ncbi:MAG: hypothetical protein EHM48_10415 [Planctomycetaceae bacterium]|nr:MAG: hypothetical protein EHM48_10415 [Planctomycetaceae bacterium]
MTGAITDDPALRQALTAAGLDSVDGAFAFGDGEDLVKGGLGHRRRTKFELTDSQGRRHELYLKRYFGEPLAWRVRRWWTYGPGKSPAQVEYNNIRRVAAAGVRTMQALAFGQQAERSYIIFTTVPGEAISRSLDAFLARHADDGAATRLAGELGTMAGRLHGAGLAHRDFYAAHIFLNEHNVAWASHPCIAGASCSCSGCGNETAKTTEEKENIKTTNTGETPVGRMGKMPMPHGTAIELYLIDLARVFSPKCRRRRWFVKDMAQLKYSLPDDWLAKHWQTLLDAYFGQLVFNRSTEAFAAEVDCKVATMRRRQQRRDARTGGSK